MLEEKPVMGQNFIHDFIDEELAPGGRCEGNEDPRSGG